MFSHQTLMGNIMPPEAQAAGWGGGGQCVNWTQLPCHFPTHHPCGFHTIIDCQFLTRIPCNIPTRFPCPFLTRIDCPAHTFACPGHTVACPIGTLHCPGGSIVPTVSLACGFEIDPREYAQAASPAASLAALKAQLKEQIKLVEQQEQALGEANKPRTLEDAASMEKDLTARLEAVRAHKATLERGQSKKG